MGILLVKTISGFVFLLVVMALALFLLAGSLAFWRAWVYLAVFSVCTILITSYLFLYDPELLARRVKGGPTAETQKGQQIIQVTASLFFIGLFVVAGLDFRFHWSRVPPILSLIAEGFVGLGFWIVFLVFRENHYTSAIIEVAREQKVITSGPYRLVRHPMYSGGGLLIIFTPLALGSWVAIPLAVLLILAIVARLLEEEKFLLAHLSDYEPYCQKVPHRLLPFLW